MVAERPAAGMLNQRCVCANVTHSVCRNLSCCPILPPYPAALSCRPILPWSTPADRAASKASEPFLYRASKGTTTTSWGSHCTRLRTRSTRSHQMD